jgi:branched-chain amino acid transport system permease protein
MQTKTIKSIKFGDRIVYFIFFSVLAVTPAIFRSPYVVTVLFFSLMYTILALSYNLVLGHTGLFSLAHAAFFAIGAYTSALLSVDWSMQFLPAILAAGLSSMVVAYAIIIVALKTTYHSFGLITLAFASIISLIYKNWVEITRGPMGIPGVPRPYFELFSLRIDFSTDIHCYYLMLVVAVLSLWLLHRVARSRVGRALAAIRENPILAESVGINSKKYMTLAFILGAFFAGISGSLYVHFVQYINPDSFAMSLTVTALAMTIIGGLGGFRGVLLTSFILYLVPELLRFSPEWREVFFGAFLLACVYLLPEGVEGLFKSVSKRLFKKRWSINVS